MKVLNFEDNAIKHYRIRRALENCGVDVIECVNNQQEGLKKLKEAMVTVPYDLIVTDMNYSLVQGGESDIHAGFKLIEKLKEENIAIPVIICSTIRYSGSDVLGAVWYNELRDIEEDFREILNRKN